MPFQMHIDLVCSAFHVLCIYMCVSTCLCMLHCFSCVQLTVTPWTVAHQTPLSMWFFRQEHWSGLPFPPPGDLPSPGIKLASPGFPALEGRVYTTSPTWEVLYTYIYIYTKCLLKSIYIWLSFLVLLIAVKLYTLQ